MPTDHETALLAAKSHLAGLHVIRALQILIDLTARKEFDPDQPRDDDGRWTNGLGSDDGYWRGPASFTDSIEGQIAHQEAMAEAANARLAEIARSSIGRNGGPSLGRDPIGTETPSSLPIRAPYAIDAYRNNFNLPEGEGTVAIANIDGKPVFGVNSTAPGDSAEDRANANLLRAQLIDKYPVEMETGNIGRMPNDALFHAEKLGLSKTNDQTCLFRQLGWTLLAKH